MIKFFRQIRHSLINQNRTKKYLLYAIGEIILVVIGILIALQINNWNEQRKDYRSSQDYRQRILEDLQVDVNALESRVGYWRKVSESGRFALTAMQDDSIFNSWKIILNLYYASQINPYDANSITFDELKSAGELRLIPDTRLRNKLANYYRLSQKRVTIIWGTSPKYRELIRGVIPIELQDYAISKCYNINQELAKGFKPCDPPIEKEKAQLLLKKIITTPQLKESLNFWIADMTIAIELAIQEKAMANDLIHVITNNDFK